MKTQNVPMEVFVQESAGCVTDQRLREETLNFSSYTAIQKEMEDARKLTKSRVATLRDWKDFADKSIVSPITRTKLKAALAAVEEAERERRAAAAPVVLDERVYRSVLNATWNLRGVGPLCGAAWDEVGGRRFQQASGIVE
ncbi:retrotransposon hot spot (RHS) protein [Trypanosoma rangeli]|uniref:Retrotransposon hot spot (RHS) protein n=1 Tax=Trypanosoma rangeli TaxID=5698 RepID=A0A422MQ90_TRYRA|nr:retrotransposon hot spot (RHS) protein [Trypanosoma rangeli]RNE95382.1 retrotransposon hot spot (RHS) protein [Trypanosoma rangeli]|eukprot:RNE95382.1 retrotransposon hot spot (RHS) protein [Trypanosoma rangeli]